MAKKEQFCFNCGMPLGIYDRHRDDLDTCGDRECEREARNAYRERDDNARERAEEDNFGAYR